MKPQDIAFVVSAAIFLLLRRPLIFVYAGLVCILLSVALYWQWIFFTAERLVWYAGFYVAVFVIWRLIRLRREII